MVIPCRFPTYDGGGDAAGFFSLAAVMRLLDSPWMTLAGWTHCLCFDLFVGRWVMNDAPDAGVLADADPVPDAHVRSGRAALLSGRPRAAGVRPMIRTIAAFALTLLSGCGGGAKEMLETAQFEELQRNTTHAREPYQQHRRLPLAARLDDAGERQVAR